MTGCGGPWSCLPWHVSQFLFPPISIFILCRYPTTTLTLVLFSVPDATSAASPKEHRTPKKNASFSSIICQLIMFWRFLIVLVNLSQEGHRLKMFRMWFVLRKLPFWILPMIFGWWLVWIPWTRPDILKHLQVPNHETHIRNIVLVYISLNCHRCYVK